MDLREVGCDPGDWIDLAEDRDQQLAYVRAVMNLRIPYKPVSQLVRQLVKTRSHIVKAKSKIPFPYKKWDYFHLAIQDHLKRK